MQKNLSIFTYLLIVSISLTFLVTTVIAAEDEERETMMQIREDRMEKREEEKAIRDEKRMMIKEEIIEKKDQRMEQRDTLIQNHADRLTNRFSNYVKRLDNIINKLKERLQILEDEGIDVSESLAKITEAEKAFENAKNYADEAIGIFNNPESEREDLLRAKELVSNSRKEFKNTLSLLKEAVRIAKSLNGGAE